jgi:hypothetical protein
MKMWIEKKGRCHKGRRRESNAGNHVFPIMERIIHYLWVRVVG